MLIRKHCVSLENFKNEAFSVLKIRRLYHFDLQNRSINILYDADTIPILSVQAMKIVQ